MKSNYKNSQFYTSNIPISNLYSDDYTLSTDNISDNVNYSTFGENNSNYGPVNLYDRWGNINYRRNRFSRNRMVSHDNNFIRLCITIITIIVELPFAGCYLFYAYSDNPCVLNKIYVLNISLKDCLLLSGYTSISVIIIVLLPILIKNNKFVILSYVILGFIVLFTFIWLIMISIAIFTNNYIEKCNEPIFTYLYASTIIRLLIYFVKFIIACK